jgi:immunity protein 21 of polymorphic toxin system
MDPASPWVTSLGGPLIVVPVSALDDWHGCTQEGLIIAGGDLPDDYDRACEIDELAATISIGSGGPQGLVLAEEPAMTCYLPEHRTFVRWLAADSETELLNAAGRVLSHPATPWEQCGSWETDGPAVLMDSVNPGSEPGTLIPLPAARWSVRAINTWEKEAWVGLVQLRQAP